MEEVFKDMTGIDNVRITRKGIDFKSIEYFKLYNFNSYKFFNTFCAYVLIYVLIFHNSPFVDPIGLYPKP